MPQSFNQIALLPEIGERAIGRVGLDEFLAQPIVKVEPQRAHELLTTLKNGEYTTTTTLTNKDGEKVEVNLTMERFAETTKLPRGEVVKGQGYKDSDIRESKLVTFKEIKRKEHSR